MAAGFFTVLILERIVLNFREMRAASEERTPLIPENINGHGHGHGHGTGPDLESSGHHVHVDFQAHSPFRSFMLFLSLSLHSVFEGLAIGLQSTDSKVAEFKKVLLSSQAQIPRFSTGPQLLNQSSTEYRTFVVLFFHHILPFWFELRDKAGMIFPTLKTKQ